jgi:hypothetical protein
MPVVALFPHPFGVITLNHDRVRFFSKGGMKLQEAVDRSPHRPKQPDLCPNPSLAHLATRARPPPPPPTHPTHSLTHPPTPLRSPSAPAPPTGSRLSAVCGGALYPPTSNKGAPHLACAMAPRDGPPVLGLLDMRASTFTTALARSSGRTALARSSAHAAAPPLQGRAHLRRAALWAREEEGPRRLDAEEGPRWWVAELAAFGRPGTPPSWPRSSRWRRQRRWCVSRLRSTCSASQAAAAC